MKSFAKALSVAVLAAMLLTPLLAWAAPRSGGSFSGRGGFRSPSGSYGRAPSSRPSYGGGRDVVVVPGFGWGWGYGWGGFGMGGPSLFGTVLMLGVVGVGTMMLVRAVRRAQARGGAPWGQDMETAYDDERDVLPGRAFVYKVQLGLGRSARGIQGRLERFAAEGDTSTEAGLASLLQQTSLELLREKDSIRYASSEAAGPLSMTNAETKLNGLALGERSRFQVERVRGADGKVRRATEAAVAGSEVLEYLVVTVLVATRSPVDAFGTDARDRKRRDVAVDPASDRSKLEGMLGALGGIPPNDLLGLEVIWTPADPDDSLTESDLLTTYPHLRSV